MITKKKKHHLTLLKTWYRRPVPLYNHFPTITYGSFTLLYKETRLLIKRTQTQKENTLYINTILVREDG